MARDKDPCLGEPHSAPHLRGASGETHEQQRRRRRRRQWRARLSCANLTVLFIFAFACYISFPRLFGQAASPFEQRHRIVVPDNNDQIWLGHDDDATATSSGENDGDKDRYLVGAGKGDITGPVVELGLMGYADKEQIGSGLRQRLYCRSFIVGSTRSPRDRFVYLILDVQSGDTAVRYGILEGLRELGPEYAMYGHDNVAVSGTHSHSGPGAWLNYLLPQITSAGFDQQSYRAIVDGCVLSIRRAHESLEPGYLTVGSTKVFGASINRSLFSYLANPAAERARYNVSAEDDGSVEKDMTMIKFQRASDGKNIGVLTWFPTHGTSMLGNNTLITGDNKGVAADLLEKKLRGGISESEAFVAGFSQANMGDVSPNILGGWCEDGSNEMCHFQTSTCGGRSGPCRARGPEFRKDDFGAASCFAIGKRQYESALSLYRSLDKQAPNVRGGSVKAFHNFHNMSGFQFTLPNGSMARTCSAALGYSFAAGTSDYPTKFDVAQGGSDSSNTSPLWRALTWLVNKPSEEQVACQHPKPVLLDVGAATKPYAWTPNIVDIQTFRVGQVLIIVSPGEVTTMAGRRWKESVAERSKLVLQQELAGQEPIVVLGGPSNSYTHYITTEEEYRVQRYEGASTLYGPHTLAAYVDRTKALLHLLGNNVTTGQAPRDAGPLPPDNSQQSYSFIQGVFFDGRPWSQNFGDTKSDVEKTTFLRGETASATFVGANPRNNLRLEQTYAAVEYRKAGSGSNKEEDDDEDDGGWTTVRDDSDWGLIFRWSRLSQVFGTSEVEIAWEIEDWAPQGEYRLRYFGDAKSIGGEVTAFEGVSRAFHVL